MVTYVQKDADNDKAPYLPKFYGFTKEDALLNDLPDVRNPFIEDKDGKRTLDYTILATVLAFNKGYTWDMDGKKWYRLMPKASWKPTHEDYINQAAREIIREFNNGKDILKRNDFLNLLDQLKSISNTDKLIKEYLPIFLEEHPEYKVLFEFDEDGEICGFNTGVIHAKNGWVVMATGEVLPECGAIFDINPLNVWYEKIPEELIKEYTIAKGLHQGKTCEEFIKKIIPDDATRDYYNYFMALAVFGKVKTDQNNHILVITGDAETGKTALTKGPVAILGNRASHLPLSQICGGFGIAPLKDKRLNVSNETEDVKINVDTVKEISDGGVMSFNRKHKDHETALIEVSLIMTGNKAPEVDYGDPGFVRRFRLIKCNEKQNPDDDLHVLFTSEEFRNWLINRYWYVLDNARKEGKNAKQMISAEMEDNENHAFYNRDYFLQYMSEKYGTFENCDEIQNRLMGKPVPEIYDDYSRFMSNRGEKPLSKAKFNDRVNQNYRLLNKPVPVDRETYGVSCKEFYRPEKTKKRPKKTTNPALRTTAEDKDSDRLAEQLAKEHGLKEYDPLPADIIPEYLTEWFISKGYATNDRIWIGPK